MANGREKEAMEIIRKAAKTNGVKPTKITLECDKEDGLPDDKSKSRREHLILPNGNDGIDNKEVTVLAKDNADESAKIIFSHRRLRRITFIVALLWFVCT